MKYGKRFLALILAVLFLAGCFSTKYPVRNQYMLDLNNSEKKTVNKSGKTIEINNITVNPAYASLDFVYRVSDEKYERDYYNVFFNPPAQQFSRAISRYLQASNIFKYVSSNPGVVRTDYVLYAEVNEFYADYRNPAKPLAVINIRFTVINPDNSTLEVIDENFYERIPFDSGNAANLIAAWDQGLTAILAKFTKRLETL